MNALETFRTRLHPSTDDDRHAIREELAEVLRNSHFTSSKRYPALLQYVVEKTLDGHADELKERILGIEVFHRPADYDTNGDTIVRVAAGEVRKRLALVYHESETERPIHITLPAGSYVPEFYRAAPPEPVAGAVVPEFSISHELAPHPPVPEPAVVERGGRWGKVAGVAALMLIAGLAGAWLARARAVPQKTSVDVFWAPVRASTTPALLVPGALVFASNTGFGVTEADRKADYPYVSMATAGVLTSLADLFARDRTGYEVQPVSAVDLSEMRAHPVVLIGAYNNKWTVRLLSDLRFRFTPKPASQIYDSKNPAAQWTRASEMPSYGNEDDFAIVARFHDDLTDNVVIVIAGLGKNGTEAAAQFVTTPRYLDLLNQPASKGWASKNMEVVLRTKVVDSKTGAPSIEAVYVW